MNFLSAQFTGIALDDVAGFRHFPKDVRSDLHLGLQLPHFDRQAALLDKGGQGLQSFFRRILVKDFFSKTGEIFGGRLSKCAGNRRDG